MPDDSLSLHSMANGGQDGKSDRKSESPVPSSGEEHESAPLKEMKSEPSPSANRDVSSEEQVPETGKPDRPLENSGFSGTHVADDATHSDSSSTVERPNPSSSTQEEREPSEQPGKLAETAAKSTPGALMESELIGDEREAEEFPAEKRQVAISGGIEEQVQDSGPAAAEIAVEKPGEATDPAQENPGLLTSSPTGKKSKLQSFPTRRLTDIELREKVMIPQYLSKGMVAAIESAGVVYHDDRRLQNVRAPECPILVFINSKSGGRLGPELEALLVDLIARTQVYDLSRWKPGEVLRYGLQYLENEADAGDKCALDTRNNVRIMVAGGDGTVGWVLGCIAEMGQKELFNVPPVGVIPLGTGNDLSRSFRWGGATTAISRRSVKRCLMKCIEADVATLDSWQLVVKPAPTCQDAPLTLPHAMHPQHHIPLENPSSAKEESKTAPYFEGFFWNYFSIGMDAQVAYGFHRLRDEAPWIASGRIANQMVYGGYSCAQGWFCTPCTTAPVLRGLRQIVRVYTKRNHDVDAQWEELELPAKSNPHSGDASASSNVDISQILFRGSLSTSETPHGQHMAMLVNCTSHPRTCFICPIRAIVILNLQSYAGGRNPWGRPSSRRREKEEYVEAKCDDGFLEIVGLRDGWHTAFVLLDWFTAVRLGQVTAVKLELKGKHHRKKAYMQMDGEPWQQPLGEASDPPAVVEINHCPVHSLCLSRK